MQEWDRKDPAPPHSFILGRGWGAGKAFFLPPAWAHSSIKSMACPLCVGHAPPALRAMAPRPPVGGAGPACLYHHHWAMHDADD